MGGVNHYAKRTTSRVVIPFMAKFIEYRILELNTPPPSHGTSGEMPGEQSENSRTSLLGVQNHWIDRTTGLTRPLG